MNRDKIISKYEALCKITQDRDVIVAYVQSLGEHSRVILTDYLRQNALEDVKNERKMIDVIGHEHNGMLYETSLELCVVYGRIKEICESYQVNEEVQDKILSYIDSKIDYYKSLYNINKETTKKEERLSKCRLKDFKAKPEKEI